MFSVLSKNSVLLGIISLLFVSACQFPLKGPSAGNDSGNASGNASGGNSVQSDQAISCVLTPSNSDVKDDELNTETIVLKIEAKGPVTEAKMAGVHVDLTTDGSQIGLFNDTPSQSRVYVATVMNGSRSATCKTSVKVTITNGPACRFQVVPQGLHLQVSSSVVSGNYDLELDKMNFFADSVTFDSSNRDQTIEMTYDDQMIKLNGSTLFTDSTAGAKFVFSGSAADGTPVQCTAELPSP